MVSIVGFWGFVLEIWRVCLILGRNGEILDKNMSNVNFYTKILEVFYMEKKLHEGGIFTRRVTENLYGRIEGHGWGMNCLRANVVLIDIQ